MNERLASGLVPPLLVLVLLYQVFSHLQIAVASDAAVIVIGTALLVGAIAGVIAAVGPIVVRVGVLVVTVVVFVDATTRLPEVLRGLTPESRAPLDRDRQRALDLQMLQGALERYTQKVGPLPMPAEYGEDSGSVNFWDGSFDVSTRDGDKDGSPVLDSLLDSGVLPTVPVDPTNEATAADDSRAGKQDAHLVVPSGYGYGGGACGSSQRLWTFMLGVTHLETEPSRPPPGLARYGCECLWREQPDLFQDYFDYIVCGTFRQ